MWPHSRLRSRGSSGPSAPPALYRLSSLLSPMRHLDAESGLPQECRAGVNQGEEEEEEEEEEAPRPWRRHHGVLLGCSPPELTCQKVYQVSIFSQLAGCSHPQEQRAPGRQPIKRACPEPQRVLADTWDAKRGRWEEGDDAIEDGLVVDELALGGTAQHFSHSGLRVVEHCREGSPSRCTPQEAGRSQVKGGLSPVLPPPPPPYRSCSTLHMTDCASVSPGDCPVEYGPAGRPDKTGAQQIERASGPNSLLDPDLHKLAHHSLPEKGLLASEQTEPGTPPGAQGSGTSGSDSSEKTPCSSAWLSGGSGGGCPAKRKLLPSAEGTADTSSEDEGLLPARKKRAPRCPAVPTSCRSTDAKGAPFWNHLLPAAKLLGTFLTSSSSSSCLLSPLHQGSTRSTAVGRQLKTSLCLKQRPFRSSPVGSRSPPVPWATTSTSRALLGNFEESMLKGRFLPSGRIEGFTAEIGASGSYCPQHATLPVEVTYFDILEHSAPSPFLGVIDLDALGKKGYSIPKTGTIQVTLFNPNKTVVKMFLVTYDFHDMPANHVTFLRHRIFLVPVDEEQGGCLALGGLPKRILCYLMHLRFHSSKSGKIYLHDNIRLLFSRKSIEIDSGIPYELKSFTELPRNPCYSPRT